MLSTGLGGTISNDWVRFIALPAVLCPCQAIAAAQSPPPATGPGTPSAPHETLTFFEGTWTAIDVPQDDNFVETCAWLPGGRRHMVCRTRWTAASGPLEGMSILSYSTKDAAYQYHGIRSSGTIVAQRGTEDQGVWRFQEEQRNGDDVRRIRVTIRSVAEGKVVFVRETALNDGPWKAEPEVRTIRITR